MKARIEAGPLPVRIRPLAREVCRRLEIYGRNNRVRLVIRSNGRADITAYGPRQRVPSTLSTVGLYQHGIRPGRVEVDIRARLDELAPERGMTVHELLQAWRARESEAPDALQRDTIAALEVQQRLLDDTDKLCCALAQARKSADHVRRDMTAKCLADLADDIGPRVRAMASRA